MRIHSIFIPYDQVFVYIGFYLLFYQNCRQILGKDNLTSHTSSFQKFETQIWILSGIFVNRIHLFSSLYFLIFLDQCFYQKLHSFRVQVSLVQKVLFHKNVLSLSRSLKQVFTLQVVKSSTQIVDALYLVILLFKQLGLIWLCVPGRYMPVPTNLSFYLWVFV